MEQSSTSRATVTSFRAEFLRVYDENLRTSPVFLSHYYNTSRPKFEALLAQLEREPFDSILEIGISEFSGIIKQVCPQAEVVGFGLHLAPPRWGCPQDVRLVKGDILAPSDFSAIGQFDVAMFSEVIEHVQGNPRAAFASLFRMVRPGGRLIVSTPNLARLFNRIKLVLGRSPLERIVGTEWAGHFREYTRDEIVEFMRDSGFVVELAENAMYWDGVDFYLQGGARGYDAEGNYYIHPRYTGMRRVLAWPLLKAVELLVSAVPSLRNGMVFVGRRPAG